jgi:DNA-binding transcriptional ArsR family regulator
VRIVESLAVRPRSVNEVVSMFNLTQPAISHHLKVLRETGLVTSTAEGQARIYRLNPRPLHELDTWLQRYRKFWSSKLDDVESHMEANP